MKKEEFYIGREFFTETGRWQCTDVGTRIIAAIKKDVEDITLYLNPPYALQEIIFDEYDQDGCVETYEQAAHSWGEDFIKAEAERRNLVSVEIDDETACRIKAKMKETEVKGSS